MSDEPSLGLRERKKAKTRAAIQTHALRLFRQQGYRQTTIEQIITAAEVSETTFFRYFPTKEDTVLLDDFDPQIAQMLRDQPVDVPPVRAIRATFRELFAQRSPEQRRETRERIALVAVEPALRAAMFGQYSQAMHLIAGVLAERAGRPQGDLDARTTAGAVIGTLMAAVSILADDPAADVATVIDRAFEHLEQLNTTEEATDPDR